MFHFVKWALTVDVVRVPTSEDVVRVPTSAPRRHFRADALYAAVGKALEAGARTRDLGGVLSTVEMGDAVLAQL
jgi:hypothetical protein